MCGFAGFLYPSAGRPNASQLLKTMTDAIMRRGPNDSGQWLDEDSGIALGHRRLAIVDLSQAGHQPMISSSGRYILVYNGEVYNHFSIRKELRDAGVENNWRGHSDTETLLASFEQWGVRETLKKCVGMFAFALWDQQLRCLTLGRDRIGEKPLYYGWQGEGSEKCFLFGSDLKALCRHPSFGFEIDLQALSAMTQIGYVPSHLSIFSGIKKLLPGTIAIVAARHEPQIDSFWSFDEVAKQGIINPLRCCAEDRQRGLETLIKDAISLQMQADVPVGAFLSGGIDSSMIVALMQEIAREKGRPPVRTFTIGFASEQHNEAPFAKAVAQHLGAMHTELYLGPEAPIIAIAELARVYSEPFADSSQIPTLLVSKLASEHVTVSLSGDAGDELFGGYNRYSFGQLLAKRTFLVPAPFREFMARSASMLSQDAWGRVIDMAAPITPKRFRLSSAAEKIGRIQKVLRAKDCSDIYRLLISIWSHDEAVVRGGWPDAMSYFPVHNIDWDDPVTHMMATDMVSYLPDDILCKVDRAAMHVSLETRVPLLDHRVVEYAWRMPFSDKCRGGIGKLPLRSILYKYVPPELVDRPKMGFGVPLGQWLRGPLRNWAEDLLGHSRLQRQGFFDTEVVRNTLAQHMLGHVDLSAKLWCILMFQAWLDEYSSWSG